MEPPLARRTGTIQPFRVVDVMEAAWAAERAGRSIVHLEVGEHDFGTPAPVVEAATKAIAAEAGGRGGVCFVDEIYGELVYDRAPGTVLAAPGLSDSGAPFVVNSFSKTFGMTGWRLGWMVCPDWALPAVEALPQNAFISP